ncbi:hypothetical protein V6N12_033224 [Hibiscus sabdariffa]
MIILFSVHSVVGDAVASSAPTTDAKVDGPVTENAKEKSSSWTDWTKNKISGIESLFSSSSGQTKSEGSPAPASAPESAVKDGL